MIGPLTAIDEMARTLKEVRAAIPPRPIVVCHPHNLVPTIAALQSAMREAGLSQPLEWAFNLQCSSFAGKERMFYVLPGMELSFEPMPYSYETDFSDEPPRWKVIR